MPSTYISASNRRMTIARAQGRCEYCQSSVAYATQSFDVDHILPVSRGGKSTLDNLAYACSGCNQHKSNHITAYDPIEEQPVALFHPRHQRWGEHFNWNEDHTLMIGLTSTGRATVEALHLNREGIAVGFG